jgi:hypothetical protein
VRRKGGERDRVAARRCEKVTRAARRRLGAPCPKTHRSRPR